MDARALRHDLERSPLSLVRPRGPRVLGVWIADDEVDAAELVEQRTVFVRRLIDAARMRVDGAHHREVGGQGVELKDRVALAADGPRDEDEFRDDALLGSKDRAELAGIHVAGRLQDHPQGLAGDCRDALHRTSSLSGQLLLDPSVEIVPEPDELGATL